MPRLLVINSYYLSTFFLSNKDITDASPEIVIDPNVLNSEGTSALTNVVFNKDGTLMAYAISKNGSDWQEIKIRDMQTGIDFPETIKWCKFSSIAWNENSEGFYYSRFPEPGTVPEGEESNHNRVYFHTLNTPQTKDIVIYERTDDKTLAFDPNMSDDYQYLLLKGWKGTENKSRLYYRAAHSNEDFIRLLDDGDAYYLFIGNKASIFYLYTNENAPNGKVIAIDIHQPEKRYWLEIIPEQEDVISLVCMINDCFVISYMHHARHQLKMYELNGKLIKKLDLPDMISITGISGKQKQKEMYISYTSFLSPTTVVRYDFTTDSLNVVFASQQILNISNYETKQVFYPSTDGTEISMFITHKKGLSLTGDQPVILYGYGGFHVSLTPTYTPSTAMWLEDGGIYAVANVRGGGEYGEAWHQAGMLEKKQQVFSDFIAAGEWLIPNNYTNTSRLAIMGGSNGGLLVSACMNQRPDLFGAVICHVPVTDMLRYHKFTVGRFWTPEYGNAEENPDHFQFLYTYSPLHNVSSDQAYPPTLITTADTDDRVVPLHAKKYTATLQKAQIGEAPILLRVEKNAGHGLGKPMSKLIEELTDVYTFLYKNLQMIE